MSRKSMQDFAFEALKRKRKPVVFKQLWDEVANEIGLDGPTAQSRMIKFYNALSLDARFYQQEGNTWDLSSRHSATKIRSDKKRYEDIADDEELIEENEELEIDIDEDDEDNEDAKEMDDEDEDDE